MLRRIISLAVAFVLVLGILPSMLFRAKAAWTVSDALITVLTAHEGFSSVPYRDNTQWSIGYGTYVAEISADPNTDPRLTQYFANPITREQGAAMMKNAMVSFENRVNTFINRYNLQLEQHQFDALVCFSYNCGAAWTVEYDGNFHNAIKNGATGDALIYAMGLWSSSAGRYLSGLIRRRMSEANMYLNNIYSPDRGATYSYILMDGNGGTVDYKIHCYDMNENEGEGQNGIYTKIKKAPTGPDEEGNPVQYVLEGWYTAPVGGTKIEVLDGTLPEGSVLYAHWMTPNGTPVDIAQEPTGFALDIAATKSPVPIFAGPDTYYATVDHIFAGQVVTITMTASVSGKYWGKTDKGWVQLANTNYDAVKAASVPFWATVIGDGVNVRDAQGTSSNVVGQKNTGDQVQVLTWAHNGGRMWAQTAEGWICMQYLEWNEGGYQQPITKVELEKAPDKTEYVQNTDNMDLTGGNLLITYEDESTKTVPLAAATVVEFDNSQIGTTTVKVSYRDFEVTFEVEIIKPTVVFKDHDGEVILEGQYAYGEQIQLPEAPERTTDGKPGIYIFNGWSSEVKETCEGEATYVAEYLLIGDLDDDEGVDEDDAIYLLWHLFFPADYPCEVYANFDGNEELDEEDAIYLLWHIFFPGDYPLIVTMA